MTPLEIQFAIAFCVSPEPAQVVPPGSWNSPQGTKTRMMFKRDGLLDEDDEPADRLRSYFEALCLVPLPGDVRMEAIYKDDLDASPDEKEGPPRGRIDGEPSGVLILRQGANGGWSVELAPESAGLKGMTHNFTDTWDMLAALSDHLTEVIE